MDACLAKLDAYVAGGGIVHQSLLALQRAPIISNSRWRLQKVCDLAQVVKVGGALMARCRVSDSLRHDMELRHDTLKGVERVLKELVVLVKQDLEIRFANTGILRHLYILDPMWDGDSRPALLAWQSHFATPAGRLEAQFDDIAAAKKAYVISNPATINSAAHEFWPPLLSAHRAHAPELCRCMAAMISMSWQNAVVERDIAIVKRVSDVAHGSLQHERLDSRCRIVVDGECEEKSRGERIGGIVGAVAQEWCRRQRRQRSPALSGKRGLQGDVPLRGMRGGPGALEQVVRPEASLMSIHDGEVEEVDIGALLG